MVQLDSYPFDKLRLPSGETAQWKAYNPTFHRTSDYGIVLTEQALYLRSPFWLALARWRRIPLNEIRRITFKDSYFTPSLRVETCTGTEVLRTPWDYRDDMDYDRENLRETEARVQNLVKGMAVVGA
ncbi:hypothetical protein [Roseateles chitinivorans]|uniref:hypothetical protein n=1 Tax=Roseateles chitinivorans TaxID=2917965 RepID=UPI003D677290